MPDSPYLSIHFNSATGSDPCAFVAFVFFKLSFKLSVYEIGRNCAISVLLGNLRFSSKEKKISEAFKWRLLERNMLGKEQKINS